MYQKIVRVKDHEEGDDIQLSISHLHPVHILFLSFSCVSYKQHVI